MIDVKARRCAAETIRHYVSGVITNKEFEKRFPYSKTDPVIRALDRTLETTYSDVSPHKLAGENAVSEELKKRVARWLLFLYSDQEYLWPRIGNAGLRDFQNETTLGILLRILTDSDRASISFMQNGDYEVWPFLRHKDFENARKHPTLLRGITQPIP
jgi:hypothetical protein